MNTTRNGVAIAVAMAGMFATQAFAEPPKPAAAPTVMCGGINTCKGQSSCATAKSACSGQNSCKGQGWLPTPSEKECKDKGGTVIPPMPMPAPAK